MDYSFLKNKISESEKKEFFKPINKKRNNENMTFFHMRKNSLLKSIKKSKSSNTIFNSDFPHESISITLSISSDNIQNKLEIRNNKGFIPRKQKSISKDDSLNNKNIKNIDNNTKDDFKKYNIRDYSYKKPETSNKKEKSEPQCIPVDMSANSLKNNYKVIMTNKQTPIKSKNIPISKNFHFHYREYFVPKNNAYFKTQGNTIYEREMTLKAKRDIKIAKMKEKIEQEELNEVLKAPKICKKSKELSKNKKPIYERIKEIQINSARKKEKIKTTMEIEKQEKYENSFSIYYTNNEARQYNDKEFQKWLLGNESWNIKRYLNIKKIEKEMLAENADLEELKFKPEINKNSIKIFNKSLFRKMKINERLSWMKESREDYKKRIEEENLPSFKPKINNDYSISEKYYSFMDKNQLEEYRELKERIENEEKKNYKKMKK
jgi:hypothetical protein